MASGTAEIELPEGMQFKYTAQSALEVAREEAQKFGRWWIGTQDVLTGLVHPILPLMPVETGHNPQLSPAGELLERSGVTLARLREAANYFRGFNDDLLPHQGGFTARAHKILEKAVEQARDANSHLITDMDLLIGIVTEGQGIARGVIESCGVSPSDIKRQLTSSPDTSPQGDWNSERIWIGSTH